MKTLTLVLILLPLSALASPLSLDSLIRRPEIEDVKISPDGSHIAVRRLNNGQRMLVFRELPDFSVAHVLRLPKKMHVGEFLWASNKRVVLRVLSSIASLESPVDYGTLYAIDYDGKNGRNIFGHLTGKMQTGSHIKKAESSYAHATVIDPLIDDNDEILISTYPWANNGESIGGVYRLNIYSGVKNLITNLPQVGGRGFTDGKGNLLFANGVDKEAKYRLYQKKGVSWELLEDPLLFQAVPVGFDSQKGDAYLVSRPLGQAERLVKLNIANGELVDIYGHEFADIDDIILEPLSKRPIGVHINPDYPKFELFEKKDQFSALFRGLVKAFDGFAIEFTSFTKNGKYGILRVYGDRLPGDYYLVNTDSKQVSIVASSAEKIFPDQLNAMEADFFTTSDGLRIGVYLTFPAQGREDLPMVVIPHGGPHARDYWAFDQTAQILSQNGYLVLQVNFRGSTGYGNAFYAAGIREWGGKVQQDIAEAVKWAVQKGYADKSRVCIYGASFGGYSAMMNPIRFPELYQCAAGYAGVYDLELMYREGDIQQRGRGIAYLQRELTEDRDFLRKNSPLYNTDRLNLPVFIIHGEEDNRAPIEHAEALLRQLKTEKKSVKSLIISREGHGFYSEKNNRKLYSQLLEFFDRHLGGESVKGKEAGNVVGE
ncbi:MULTISPECIES: prolyl oligopeptidase family serine peptidase [unclassified Microbulbifer]|uniref:alpha/beta hydrolase family protein n=1 Tax=unclassified Microbulbifer TaxID=2619833 RepID=UPI0027E431C5|nr:MULTISPECIES: prolyl oligopeptidase family serine peptidase [unclassified Microbulbifer]